MTFGPFRRFRLRANPTPEPVLPSSEEDSDESSPERDQLRIVHLVAPRTGFKLRERLFSTPESSSEVVKSSRHAPKKSTESMPVAPSFNKAAHPSSKVSRSGLPSVTCPSDPVIASPKSTLIRRVTSKLMISIPTPQTLHSRPSTQTLPAETAPPLRKRRSSRANLVAPPTLPNTFVSKGHREAALRERGLLPPRKDLSEQERDADARLRCIPSPASTTFDGLSEAERLRASWFEMNRTSESSDSEWLPPDPPYLQGTRSRAPPSSSSSVPPDASRRSGEGSVGRLSTCSSCPPLSTSSNLEVLLEEPSEQGPITPPPPLSPAKLMITVSNIPDALPSPVIVESPVSCTFSSHCPGSTLESSVLGKENGFPRASRRSGERSRKGVGPYLSTMGTRSLTNLRRSVVGSLRLPSSSTLSTADVPPTPTSAHLAAFQVPRTALSPTIHSPASILWETKGIADIESRRLSELAFLH